MFCRHRFIASTVLLSEETDLEKAILGLLLLLSFSILLKCPLFAVQMSIFIRQIVLSIRSNVLRRLKAILSISNSLIISINRHKCSEDTILGLQWCRNISYTKMSFAKIILFSRLDFPTLINWTSPSPF